MMPDHDSSKSGNSSSVSQFLGLRKSQWKYLIKPMENGYFLSQKAKKGSKIIKKALGFALWITWRSTMSQNLIKPMGNLWFWRGLNPKNRQLGSRPDSSSFILHPSSFIRWRMKKELLHSSSDEESFNFEAEGFADEALGFLACRTLTRIPYKTNGIVNMRSWTNSCEPGGNVLAR